MFLLCRVSYGKPGSVIGSVGVIYNKQQAGVGLVLCDILVRKVGFICCVSTALPQVDLRDGSRLSRRFVVLFDLCLILSTRMFCSFPVPL